MTDDDVVETMARAGFIRNWAAGPNGMGEDELFALRKKTDRAVWQMHLANTRAAIRALHERGGLVVGMMPEDGDPPNNLWETRDTMNWLDGYNAASQQSARRRRSSHDPHQSATEAVKAR